MLTEQERIKEYIKNHNKPNRKLLPTNLWIGWLNVDKNGHPASMGSKNLITGRIYDKLQPFMNVDTYSRQLNTNEITNLKQKIHFVEQDAHNLYNAGYNGISHGIAKKEDNIWAKRGVKLPVTYIDYDSKLKVYEIGMMLVDTNKGTENVPNNVEFHINYPRIFIPYNTKHFYNKNGVKISYVKYYGRHGYSSTAWGYQINVSKYITFLCGMSARTYEFENNFNALKNKAFPNNILLSSGVFCPCKSIYNLIEYFDYDSPLPTTGPKQEIINKLCKIQYRDINSIVTDTDTENMAFMEKVDDEWSVLRVIQLKTPYGMKLNKPFEILRSFINNKKNKTIEARISTRKDWITAKGGNEYLMKQTKIINMDQLSTNTQTKYIKDIAEDYQGNYSFTMKLLKYPILEKLYKSGYLNLVKHYLDISATKTHIQDDFKITDKDLKKKSLFQILGVNKHQLEIASIINEDSRFAEMKNLYTLKSIKEYCTDTNISTMSDEKFDLYMLVLKTTGRYSSLYRAITEDCFITSSNSWDISAKHFCRKTKEECEKIVLKFARLQKERHEDFLRIVKDAVLTLKKIYSYEEDFNYDIERIYKSKDFDEIVDIHDSLVMYYNNILRQRGSTYRFDKTEKEHEEEIAAQRKAEEERDRMLKEKRDTTIKERSKWNYEDDKYIIRLPKTDNEIVSEGLMLDHCVGGYATNHFKGDTTIMFLRQKETPDTSWFTIEISLVDTKEKKFRVNQIHGSHNRWLSNTTQGYEAVPTMVKWLNMHNIYCESSILLNKSSGYSNHGELADLPEGIKAVMSCLVCA